MRTLFILAMTLAFLVGTAGANNTFYIDYASGSNSNPGTKVSPWKSHPYMNCGPAPTYTHTAGDQFIFKGGVTWPASCFRMSIPTGGSSGNSDYYGVDLTWFSGGSFTRPLFDLGQSVPTGRHVITVGSGFGGYVTFDNLEIANQQVPLGVSNSDDAYNFTAKSGSMPGVLIKNGYIHDWISNTDVGAQSNTFVWPYSAGAIDDGSDRITVDHMTVSGQNSWVFNGATKVVGGYSGGCVNCGTVSNSTWHDFGAACFTVANCYGNEFYHGRQSSYDLCACRPHSQVIEDDIPAGSDTSGSWMKIYNNVIHDNTAGVTIYVPYVMYVFNNVMWNNSNSSILLAHIGNDSTSATGYVENNTISCPSTHCVATDSKPNNILGKLYNQNNHYISNGSPSPTCFSPTGTCATITVVASNNVTMTATAATSQGYTTSNVYQPTASSNGTVNAGVNLSSLCNLMPALCSDRLGNARLTTWDAGAYEWGGAVAAKPNPPANLTATVQ